MDPDADPGEAEVSDLHKVWLLGFLSSPMTWLLHSRNNQQTQKNKSFSL